MRVEIAIAAGCLCLATLNLACAHKTTPAPSPAPPVTTAARPLPLPEPPPPPAPVAPRSGSAADAIYFTYDAALLPDDGPAVLQEVARRLSANPRARLRIEGNCDERGTTEYNVALGENRARVAEQYLLRLGIPASRIEIVSYGSERPRERGHDESAWARNRRDDFLVR
jgi:peptidoglycan-associated lipoprotein